ncbi:MAG: hypothetical protein V4696_01530 [Pseudomonadota bacterium]
MKALILAGAFALSACVPALPTNIPTAPVEVANRTAADEQIAIGVESGYKAFRLAIELGVDTGVIKGERASRAASADKRAYAALLVLRQAYATANAADFLTAARAANAAVSDAITVAKGR